MPATASIASRTISASSRVGALRQSRRSPASRSSAFAIEPRRLTIGGRRDDQPVHRLEAPAVRDHLARPASRAARGARAVPPLKPRSLGVSTRPVPKCACQSRLTTTRAKSGLCGLEIHDASRSRRRASGASGGRPKSAPGATIAATPPGRHHVAGLVGIPADLDVRRPRLSRRHGVGLARADRQATTGASRSSP